MGIEEGGDKSIAITKSKQITFQVVSITLVSPNNLPGKYPLEAHTCSSYSIYEVPEEVAEKLKTYLRDRLKVQR